MIYDFNPQATYAQQYTFTLDGAEYKATITWNIAGERFYLNVFSMREELIFSRPLIGSPTGYDISISAGYFKTQIVYRPKNRQIETI